MIDESILKAEEKAVYNLRSLYARYGYQPYKMSKFEEYDLYARNKDFLVSDGIISFTDTNGKLMALKPDVTLSILKNSKDVPHCTQRVYYNENVYRISGDTHQFKEIMQTGLECIGIIDFFNTTEVLKLAARSLETLSPNYVLEISHMGILNALLEEEDAGDRFNEEITSCLDEKNPHELSRICRKYQSRTHSGKSFWNLSTSMESGIRSCVTSTRSATRFHSSPPKRNSRESRTYLTRPLIPTKSASTSPSSTT